MFKWLDKHLLGSLFGFLKTLFIILWTSLGFAKDSATSWRSLFRESKSVEAVWNDENRKAYDEMISGHAPGELERAVKNLMLFSIVIWMMLLGAVVLSIATLSYSLIGFVSALGFFAIFGLGYPIWMIKNRSRVPYTVFLGILIRHRGWKAVLPAFSIELRG